MGAASTRTWPPRPKCPDGTCCWNGPAIGCEGSHPIRMTCNRLLRSWRCYARRIIPSSHWLCAHDGTRRTIFWAEGTLWTKMHLNLHSSLSLGRKGTGWAAGRWVGCLLCRPARKSCGPRSSLPLPRESIPSAPTPRETEYRVSAPNWPCTGQAPTCTRLYCGSPRPTRTLSERWLSKESS